jgi:hypothetical protein
MTLMGRGTSNVLSYRYATGPEWSHIGYSRPKLLLSRAISALAALTLRIPIPLRMWSAATARDGDSPAFPLVRACVEPPPESNRRPHPYYGTTRNRCADPRFPSSRPTVRVKVIGSLSPRLCVFFPRSNKPSVPAETRPPFETAHSPAAPLTTQRLGPHLDLEPGLALRLQYQSGWVGDPTLAATIAQRPSP